MEEKKYSREPHTHYCTNLLVALQREVRQSAVGGGAKQEQMENIREETGEDNKLDKGTSCSGYRQRER